MDHWAEIQVCPYQVSVQAERKVEGQSVICDHKCLQVQMFFWLQPVVCSGGQQKGSTKNFIIVLQSFSKYLCSLSEYF